MNKISINIETKDKLINELLTEFIAILFVDKKFEELERCNISINSVSISGIAENYNEETKSAIFSRPLTIYFEHAA